MTGFAPVFERLKTETRLPRLLPDRRVGLSAARRANLPPGFVPLTRGMCVRPVRRAGGGSAGAMNMGAGYPPRAGDDSPAAIAGGD